MRKRSWSAFFLAELLHLLIMWLEGKGQLDDSKYSSGPLVKSGHLLHPFWAPVHRLPTKARPSMTQDLEKNVKTKQFHNISHQFMIFKRNSRKILPWWWNFWVTILQENDSIWEFFFHRRPPTSLRRRATTTPRAAARSTLAEFVSWSDRLQKHHFCEQLGVVWTVFETVCNGIECNIHIILCICNTWDYISTQLM